MLTHHIQIRTNSLFATFRQLNHYLQKQNWFYFQGQRCAILATTVQTIGNLVFQDKFFLISAMELFGNTGFPGTVLEYYDGASSAERIKYYINGTAANYWTRSGTTAVNAGWCASSTANGTINSAGATNPFGVAPACIIA